MLTAEEMRSLIAFYQNSSMEADLESYNRESFASYDVVVFQFLEQPGFSDFFPFIELLYTEKDYMETGFLVTLNLKALLIKQQLKRLCGKQKSAFLLILALL